MFDKKATYLLTPCRLRGCKNRPAPFPGWMLYNATKLGLVCLSYLSMLCCAILWFIRAAFYVLLVFVAVCSVFWLFWLSCHYLPSHWLERPLWGSLTIVRGLSLWSPGRRELMIVLVYCILSLFNCMMFVLSPALSDIFPISMAWYSLFVLKVP